LRTVRHSTGKVTDNQQEDCAAENCWLGYLSKGVQRYYWFSMVRLRERADIKTADIVDATERTWKVRQESKYTLQLSLLYFVDGTSNVTENNTTTYRRHIHTHLPV